MRNKNIPRKWLLFAFVLAVICVFNADQVSNMLSKGLMIGSKGFADYISAPLTEAITAPLEQ